MGNYKLDSVVKEYLIEIGDTAMNRYARYYQLGVSCLRSLNTDLSGVPQIKFLAINDNDTVDLPVDYLQYTRIGICGTDGEVHSLGLNSKLSLNSAFDNCGNKVSLSPSTSDSLTVADVSTIGVGYDFYSDHYRNGELMGKFFGIGGGNNVNGSYRIDKENNTLLLSGVNSNVAGIVVEYIADVTVTGDDFVVHPFLVETVKAWIFWKVVFRDRNRSLGEKQLAEDDYWNNYRRSKRRYNAFTVDQFLQTIRSGNLGAVKW